MITVSGGGSVTAHVPGPERRASDGGGGGVAADVESVWIHDAQQGSDDAFARLVEAYQVPVYNLAYRMLGNATEAEDAAQETFLRAYRRLETYDSGYKFSSWILSIASHYCVDRLRRRRGNTLSMEETESSRWLPDERPRPEELALRGEQSEIIRDLMEELPTHYRLVIVMRYWHDLSYEEIATVTHSTVSAVKSRLHRARQLMAAKIADPTSLSTEGDRRRESEYELSQSF